MAALAALSIGGTAAASCEGGGSYWCQQEHLKSPGVGSHELRPQQPRRSLTRVVIVGEEFHVNGRPASEGKTWKGASIQGTLFNSRSKPTRP